MIQVTKTFIPKLERYIELLQPSWDNSWLTNRGALVVQLENKIQEKLICNQIIAMTNGTLPLQIAIKALQLKGEIITTPFSYIATTSSIVWEGCSPVFVDIHPDFLTIDETKIEAAITNKTTAIMATHVFGNPCHVEEIERIAKMHNLKVIYDAAHCFGVQYKGQSVFNYGDVSTCSFHATKVFHTGEGGALFCNDEEMFDTYYYHHNFGHNGPENFHGLGINAKMSELQAAMGLSVLENFDQIIEARKLIVEFYNLNIHSDQIKKLTLRNEVEWNYSYYPITFKTEKQLMRAIMLLNDAGIYPRRYFYPSLNTVNYLNSSKKKISESVAKRILCLPLYVGLPNVAQKRIVEILNEM